MKTVIKKISPEKESEAVRTVAQAIVNDPGICYFLPQAAKREHQTTRMVRSISSIMEKSGQKYLIEENNKVVAVAMWLPPGKEISNLALIKKGFLLVPFVMGLRVFIQFMKFLDFTSILQEKHMQNRKHGHLFYLTVHPSYQRKGFGKKILSAVLQDCDKKQAPVFLQTFTAKGVKFFQKNGFQLISEMEFSKDCIMHCMIREPRPAGKTETKKALKQTPQKTKKKTPAKPSKKAAPKTPKKTTVKTKGKPAPKTASKSSKKVIKKANTKKPLQSPGKTRKK